MALNSPFSTALDEHQITTLIEKKMGDFTRLFYKNVIQYKLDALQSEMSAVRTLLERIDQESKLTSVEKFKEFVVKEVAELKIFYRKIYEREKLFYAELMKKK